MNLERRSFRSEKPIWRRWRMTSSASPLTILIASFSLLSDPKLSALLILHITGHVPIALSADTLDATSNATANSDTGIDSRRHPGSTPNENLQITSNENRRNTSCKSTAVAIAAADITGISLVRIWAHTISKAWDRTATLPSSRLAILRWKRHVSPSTLKMPWPRRSPRSEENGCPFG